MSRSESIMELFKIAMPRYDEPLYSIPDQRAEYDEDFYPDIEPEVIEGNKSLGNLYHGKNVIWVGNRGKMMKADPDYIYPISGNTFYPEKITQLVDKINRSEEKVMLYPPYGEASKVDASDIEESIQNSNDSDHNQLTTGDEDLDEYLESKEDYILNNADYDWDDDDEKIESATSNLRAELEGRLKDAELSGDGDFGKFIYQIRDGNHRAFAAIAAGEDYIWIMMSDNQFQSVEEGDPWVEGYQDILG